MIRMMLVLFCLAGCGGSADKKFSLRTDFLVIEGTVKPNAKASAREYRTAIGLAIKR